MLLLSFGQQPRSWIGDLGAAIADRVAAAGFLAFRFDMPGLGDSPGDLPLYLEVLWREIQLGGHTPYLLALCRKLQKEYSLSGLVVGGFCGGAVTALYCVNSNDVKVKGLLLLEPEIALQSVGSGEDDSPAGARLDVEHYLERKDLFFRRLLSARSWGKLLTLKFDYGFWREFIAQSLRTSVRRARRGRAYPPETNHRLLDAWDRARRRSIPTFVISVGSANRRTYYKSYGFDPGGDRPGTRLSWIEIPHTTHAMLAGGAKAAICDYIEKWFVDLFP
jgi:pimeloyl-ACP methyl ester carboxylesterase